MNELRWDPLLKEWVIVAANRDKRPVLGKTFKEDPPKKDAKMETPKVEKAPEQSAQGKTLDKDPNYKCPFCPGSEEVKDANWEVLQLGNRFSSLHGDLTVPWVESSSPDAIWPTRPALGKNEVILYTPEHYKHIGQLKVSNLERLTELWAQRYTHIAKDELIKYIFIMENRGKEIGVSLEHPHGQIYCLPFLPPRIEREFNSVNEYKEKHGKCLYCEIMEKELKSGKRVICQNDSFVAFVPYFTHFAYEIHIYCKKHIPSIADFDQQLTKDFARILKEVVLRYDALKGGIMPYVMAQHNAPSNIPKRENWHFHVEFYTIYRGPERIKYLAGVELGCNTFVNDVFPEDAAARLRDVTIEKVE
jgi:UDPglucose--hexose-1-phosphate uridylyltransferase